MDGIEFVRCFENVWDEDSEWILRRLGLKHVRSKIIRPWILGSEAERLRYAARLFQFNRACASGGLPWLNSPACVLKDYERAALIGATLPPSANMVAVLTAQQKEFDGLRFSGFRSTT